MLFVGAEMRSGHLGVLAVGVRAQVRNDLPRGSRRVSCRPTGLVCIAARPLTFLASFFSFLSFFFFFAMGEGEGLFHRHR